jgi:hypothetical protein
VDIREQLSEQLAPANRVTVVPSGDKICQWFLSLPLATGSISALPW